MKIFVTGPEERYKELSRVLPPKADTDYAETIDRELDDYDLIFDLNLDENPEKIDDYKVLAAKPIFASSVKASLAEIAAYGNNEIDCYLFGLNALPTFIIRDLKEVSLWNPDHKTFLEQWTAQLEWDYQLVEDRAGMVTPRVIMMIINEACYTLQEGTASIADIDKSLKKGVNYPKGPFEWADQVGIKAVYETLESLYEDTKDDRYKIAPLLKRHYLKDEGFWT